MRLTFEAEFFVCLFVFDHLTFNGLTNGDERDLTY